MNFIFNIIELRFLRTAKIVNQLLIENEVIQQTTSEIDSNKPLLRTKSENINDNSHFSDHTYHQNVKRSHSEDFIGEVDENSCFESLFQPDISTSSTLPLQNIFDEMTDGCYFCTDDKESYLADESLIYSRVSSISAQQVSCEMISNKFYVEKLMQSDFDKVSKNLDNKIVKRYENDEFRSEILTKQLFFMLMLIFEDKNDLIRLISICKEIPSNEKMGEYALKVESSPIFNFEYIHLILYLRIEHFNNKIHIFEKKKEVYITKIEALSKHVDGINDSIMGSNYTLVPLDLKIVKKTGNDLFPAIIISNTEYIDYINAIDSLIKCIDVNYDILHAYLNSKNDIFSNNEPNKKYMKLQAKQGLVCNKLLSLKSKSKKIIKDYGSYTVFLNKLKSDLKIILIEINIIMKDIDNYNSCYQSKVTSQTLYYDPVHVFIFQTKNNSLKTRFKLECDDPGSNIRRGYRSEHREENIKNDLDFSSTLENLNDNKVLMDFGHSSTINCTVYDNTLKIETINKSNDNKTFMDKNRGLVTTNDRHFMNLGINTCKRDYNLFLFMSSNYNFVKSEYKNGCFIFLEMMSKMKKYLKSLEVRGRSKINFEKQYDFSRIKYQKNIFLKLSPELCKNLISKERKTIYFKDSFTSSYLEFQRYKTDCESVLPEIKCIIRFLYILGESEIKKNSHSSFQNHHSLISILILFNTFNMLKFQLYLMLIRKRLMPENTSQIIAQDNIIENLVWTIRREIINYYDSFDYKFKCHAYCEILKLFTSNEDIDNMKKVDKKVVQIFFDNLLKELLLGDTSGTKIFTTFCSLMIVNGIKVQGKEKILPENNIKDIQSNISNPEIRSQGLKIDCLYKYLSLNVPLELKAIDDSKFKRPFH